MENGSSEELDKAAPASTSLLSGSSGRTSSNRPRPEPSKKDGSVVEGITPLAQPPPPPSSVHDMEVGEIETELEKLKQSIKTSDLFGQKKKKAAHESWQDTVLVPAAKSMDSEEEATMMQEILEDESNRTQQRVTTTNIDEGSSSDDDSDDMFSATPGTLETSRLFLGIWKRNSENRTCMLFTFVTTNNQRIKKFVLKLGIGILRVMKSF